MVNLSVLRDGAEPEAPGRGRKKADGTQAIRRATAMLKQVAQHGPVGVSLAELAAAQDLARSTAHRILKCLLEEQLLEQDPLTKRYRMGHLLHEFSMVPGWSTAEVARWRPLVEAVARRCGVTSYLMRRSGVEAVCLIKVDGYAAMRFVPVDVGQRRLLGVGGGATALLAALPPDQLDEVIRLITPGLRMYPRITPVTLKAAVDQVQHSGFALSRQMVVERGFGMGAIIPHAANSHLAVSIAAYGDNVTESVISTWQDVFTEEIARFV